MVVKLKTKKNKTMLDTVKLCVSYDHVQIDDFSRFNINPQYIQRNGTCYRAPTIEEANEGIPYIEIKVIPQNGEPPKKELRIFFSVPKLIFGNNYTECKDSDFQLVIDTLKDKLEHIWVHVSKSDLENAYVSRIDYGKNILLDTRTKTIIKALKSLPQSKHKSVDENDFQNHGSQIRIQTQYTDYKIYDKFYDIQKNDKSTIVTDKGSVQLIDFLEANNIRNIIRLEYSLKSVREIRNTFDKCGINVYPSFRNIFNSNIARIINLYSFDSNISKHKSFSFMQQTRYGTIIDKCYMANKSIYKTLAIIGVRALMTRENGIQSLTERYSNTTLTIVSLQKEIDDLDLDKNAIAKALKHIREELDNNKPIRDGAV